MNHLPTEREIWNAMPTAERVAYVISHVAPSLFFAAVLLYAIAKVLHVGW